ncbi:MAG TPA: type II 3-dehydroquinate dehydratase, partial [Rhizomicrobium sp.]|nr:type II 3-dehydroquinate dehydratase [Rhizomicrobium sp.]
MARKTRKSKTLPIYIINGPNLNLLGTREPEVYGRTTLGDIETLCAARAKSHGLSIVFLQSN